MDDVQRARRPKVIDNAVGILAHSYLVCRPKTPLERCDFNAARYSVEIPAKDNGVCVAKFGSPF